MAFTGGITTVKKQNFSSNDDYKPQSNDRLVTIEGYDVDRGIIKVKTTDNRKMEVHIDPESIKRNNLSLENNTKATSAQWMGHLINQDMANNLKVNGKIVIEKAKILKKIKVDGEDVYVVQANRIINVPTPKPTKVIEGLFTVTSFVDTEGPAKVERLGFIQHWADTAIDINDEEGIEKIKAAMKIVNDDYKKMVADKMVIKPTVGFQFRTLLPSEDDKYTAIDASVPFDYIYPVKDDDGNVITAGHPITPEVFEDLIGKYIEHITANYPDDVSNIKLEILPYDNYFASKSNGMMVKEQHADPIHQLARTKVRLSLAGDVDDPSNILEGKGWAVRGIIQISDDEVVEVSAGKYEGVPKNYVNRLHANNPKGHVQAWVRSSDGKKVVPHKGLQRVLSEEEQIRIQEYANKTKKAESPKSNSVSEKVSTPAAADIPASTSADAPFNVEQKTDEPEFDIFGEDTPAQSVAPAAKLATAAKRFAAKK